MIQISFLLSIVLLILSTTNIFLIRRPKVGAQIQLPLSVLVPLRNEIANVESLIKTLKSQAGLTDTEFIFLDDNSSDDTLKALEIFTKDFAGSRIISGKELPAEWIGKTWALQQLFDLAKGEIIITIDADVRLAPDAINAAVNLIQDQNLDFISPYPAQIATTLSQRLIQPLLQWSWMATVPLRFAEKSANPAFAIANGQFFLVRASVLTRASGYNAIKGEVLDDIFLARQLLRTGSHGSVVDGSRIASCQMYFSWQQIRAGYGKSLWKAFGSKFGSALAIIFIFLTGILPIIAALSGSPLAWITFDFILLTRIFSAYRSGGRILDSFLHPLSAGLLIYLIIYSWSVRKTVRWKGRTI